MHAVVRLYKFMQIAEVSKLLDNYTPGSGIYNINNLCQSTATFRAITQDIFPPMQARCNMESSDGGWTVLVRRTPDVDEQVSFKRPWVDYENGFGNLSGEFWYGLKNMHCLTSRESMEVEVELRNNDGTKRVLSYGNFRVDGPSTSYKLEVSDKQYEGHDFFLHQNGNKFSTFDKDNDNYGTSCSMIYNEGGNWFNRCYNIYLTDTPKPKLYDGTSYPYDYAELRVRPKGCTA